MSAWGWRRGRKCKQAQQFIFKPWKPKWLACHTCRLLPPGLVWSCRDIVTGIYAVSLCMPCRRFQQETCYATVLLDPSAERQETSTSRRHLLQD